MSTETARVFKLGYDDGAHDAEQGSLPMSEVQLSYHEEVYANGYAAGYIAKRKEMGQ